MKIKLFFAGFIMTTIFLFPLASLGQWTRTVVKHSIPDQSHVISNDTTYVMDFESVTDFSLTFGDWTVIDADHHDTYGITNYSFPHQMTPMAYLAFNPSQVTPSMAGDPAIQPHGGQRFGACFSSNPPSNDDWIISPKVQLGTNGLFSFWVKSYVNTYGLDTYQVLVSTTDSLTTSFTSISGSTPLETTTTWTKKSFNLSSFNNQKIYVAIRCVSNDHYLMMIDDLELKPQSTEGVIADFTADKTTLRVGETVNFFDQSTGVPTSWAWTFPGGTPASSTLQNPSAITYSAKGIYPVTLIVSNGSMGDTITKTGFISVTGYPSSITLDFDTLKDFTLQFNPWFTEDVKGGNTYGINQPSGAPVSFPHTNEPMAYLCFNPSKTNPPLTNMLPHSGQKLGCSFSSVPPMNPNNKWLISPKLSLGNNPQIELWVQTYNNIYGDERYYVAVSTTDTDPVNFTSITTSSEAAPATWTRKTYSLATYANQDVYVGIQCVTDNGFIFMIDDISITSSVGIAEPGNFKNPLIYPNPAKDQLNVKWESSGIQKMTLELINSIGEKCRSWENDGSSNKASLNIRGLNAGIYLLHIQQGTEEVWRKISIL